MSELILSTIAQVADATGLSRWSVAAIKCASRGQPDSPWSGRFTTASRIEKWLFAHEDFIASRVLLRSADNCAGRRHSSSSIPSFRYPNPCPNPTEPETNPNPNPTLSSQPRIRTRTRSRTRKTSGSGNGSISLPATPAGSSSSMVHEEIS
jgi:hypothetical protein